MSDADVDWAELGAVLCGLMRTVGDDVPGVWSALAGG